MLKSAINSSIVFLICLAAGLGADGPQFWTNNSRNDFMSGKAEGVSILADESLSLAQKVNLKIDTGEPFIWALAADSSGTVYAATGHDGRVLKISAGGDTATVFDALEPEVTALAVNRSGDLFVGASPEGRVYRIPKGKDQGETFFDPEEKYIWDLVFGADGNLYVAVGANGKIYRVDQQGNSRLILDSEEQHITSMTFDRKGNLLAGSSGSAFLYQVDPGENVSIIYDSPLKEIKSIVVDSENNLFVAAFEIKTPAEQAKGLMPGPEVSTDTPSDGKDSKGDESSKPAQEFILRRPPQPRGPSTNSEIYFFDQDRFVTRLWRETGVPVRSLGMIEHGRAMFVSKKEENELFVIDKRGELTRLNSFEESDVTGFLPLSGRMLICTANPGKVFEVAKGNLSRGTFTSKVLNGGIPAKWGKISWEGQIPPSTRVYFRTRSGNTARPDTTWSPWSRSTGGKSAADITSPVRRYFQWQAVLESDNPAVTPRLKQVTVSYIRRNRPPMISPIRFMPQGLYIKSSSAPLEKPEVVKAYPYEVEKLMNNKKPGSTENPFQGKKEYGKRFRMAGWNANDPNGDELRYNVHYRGVSESIWRPLESSLEENSAIFDTESMADGKYVLRVTAHDSLDNPGARAESSQRTSPVFTVDNTPPSIRNLRISKIDNGTGFELSFQVQDMTSRIERVEVAVDAEKTRRVAPVDQIQDSLQEDFRLVWDKVSPGEHTVTVQAYDQFYNLVTVRQSIKLP